MIDAYLAHKDSSTGNVISDTHSVDARREETQEQDTHNVAIDTTTVRLISDNIIQSVTTEIRRGFSVMLKRQAANDEKQPGVTAGIISKKFDNGINAVLTSIKNHEHETRLKSALATPDELYSKIDGISAAIQTISDRMETSSDESEYNTTCDHDILADIKPALSAIETAEQNIHHQLRDFSTIIEDLRAEHESIETLKRMIYSKDQVIKIKDEYIAVLKNQKKPS